MRSRIAQAIRDKGMGDTKFLRLLEALPEGFNVDQANAYDGLNLVNYVARHGSHSLLQLLIANGYSIDTQESLHNLMYDLSWNDCGPAFELHLEKIYKKFNDNTTLLHVKAFTGDCTAIAMILTSLPDTLTRKNRQGKTAMYYAALAGQSDAAILLLSFAKSDLKNHFLDDLQQGLADKLTILYNSPLWNAKHLISTLDRIKKIASMVPQKNADSYAQIARLHLFHATLIWRQITHDNRSITDSIPLLISCLLSACDAAQESNNKELYIRSTKFKELVYLIFQGDPPDMAAASEKVNSIYSLMIDYFYEIRAPEIFNAIAENDLAKCIKYRATLSDRDPRTRIKPMAYAAQCGSIESLEYFLTQDSSKRGWGNETHGFYYWLLQNNPTVFRKIASLPDLHQEFDDNTTDLHYACIVGNAKNAAKILTRNPERLIEATSRGETAVYFAALAGHSTLAQFLLQQNSFTQTPNGRRWDQLRWGLEDLIKITEHRVKKFSNDAVSSIDLVVSIAKLLPRTDAKFAHIHSLIQNSFSEMRSYLVESNISNEKSPSPLFFNNFVKLYKKLDRLSFELLRTNPGSVAAQISENALSMQTLTKQVNNYGLTALDIPGEGACFFHALADQLENLAIKSISATHLRELALSHIMHHLTEYQSRFEDNETECEYMDKMSNDGAWVDDAMMTALATVFRINIVIFRSDEQAPQIFHPSKSKQNVCLGLVVGMHYVSLRRAPSLAATQSIEGLVSLAIKPGPSVALNRQTSAHDEGKLLLPINGFFNPSTAIKKRTNTNEQSSRPPL